MLSLQFLKIPKINNSISSIIPPHWDCPKSPPKYKILGTNLGSPLAITRGVLPDYKYNWERKYGINFLFKISLKLYNFWPNKFYLFHLVYLYLLCIPPTQYQIRLNIQKEHLHNL